MSKTKSLKCKENKSIFWHGSPSGDLRGGKTGLHVGTKLAATEALEARIGIPAKGSWNGKKEYFLCVNCHNPHSPKFNELKPEPPPIKQEEIK